MPKLSNETAQKTAAAEGGNFEPLPEDVYTATLYGEVQVREGASGNPYWSWTFKIAEGPHTGRTLWLSTGLSDQALWRLKEVFAAFGVPADTDTDDLIGRRVKLLVTQKIIGAGSRKGEIGNEIQSLLPAEGNDTPTNKKSATYEEDLPLF